MNAWADYFRWVGALAVTGVATQAVWMATDLVRRRRHERRQHLRQAELLDERIRAVRRRATHEAQKSLAWGGWRKFQVVRKEFEDAARSQCSFYLAPHDGKPLPPFEPGQYLTFQVEIPGEAKPIVRCYSLSDCHRPDGYRVTIKRAPDPCRVSGYFLDHVNVADVLDVRAPSGPFKLDVTRRGPVVLIGGGIGVTPVLAMLNAILGSDDGRETWFFYGVRGGGDAAFVEQVRRSVRGRSNVHAHICYSRPDAGDESGRDYDHAGRVSVELIKRLLPSNNYDFYVCGPCEMMESIKSDLTAWGVPRERIHSEDFSPPREAAKLDPAAASGPPVTFKKSGRTVNWNTQAKNLLEFALANGVEIDAGCWVGNCGTCRRAVLKGEVEYGREIGFECETGTCLTCCAIPRGAMEIDA